MSDWQLKTPVVFLVFNRPDAAARVFEEIRRARPPVLLVVADGPRADRPGESEKCQQVRAIIDRVDWPCEVLRNYSDVNLGCKIRVSSGLDWAFELVEEAIILEDDCLPHPDFFPFCEKLLDYYRFDSRIMMICGTNYLLVAENIAESYFFSNYYPIWGWATWCRAWKLYDVKIKAWSDFKKRNQLYWIFSHRNIALYYDNMFDLIYNGFDTWDIQWWFTCIFHHGLAIVPKTNLISNLGEIGTHTATQKDLYTNMSTYPIDIKHIRHPRYVTPDIALNRLIYELSHAGVIFSVKNALKKRRFKSAIKAMLPLNIIRLMQRIKNEM
jgi:hypothetical protein